jgi:hypothetical protein
VSHYQYETDDEYMLRQYVAILDEIESVILEFDAEDLNSSSENASAQIAELARNGGQKQDLK